MTAAQLDVKPYWHDSSQMPRFEPLARDLRVDVGIIGAGLTGLTAAYLLKRAGKNVAVIDRDRIGGVDTGHTTAHVTCVTDSDLASLVDDFGRDHAQAVWDAGLAAIAEIDTIIDRESIDCHWAWVPGYKFAALDGDAEREADRLRKEAALATALGFEATFVRATPFFNRPGIEFAGQARFHPRKYLAALATLVDGDGSHVHEHTESEEIVDDPLSITAGGHTITCDYVIIATHTPLMGKTNILSATLFQSKLFLYSTYVIGGRVPSGTIPDALFWDTADPYHYLRLDRRGEPEPVVTVSPGVGSLDNPEPAIVANSLAADANAFHCFRRHCREIDVDQRPRRERSVHQRAKHSFRPGLRRGERNCIAHAFAGVDLAEGYRPDTRQRALHRRRNGSGIGHVLRQISAPVNTGQDEVGRSTLHDMGQRHHHRVGRRPADRISPFRKFPKADRAGQGQRMAGSGLLLGRRHSPHIIGQFGGNRLEQGEARGVDAIVVCQEDTHRVPMADCAALKQPPAFSLQQSTVNLVIGRSVLVKVPRLNYERVGDADIPDISVGNVLHICLRPIPVARSRRRLALMSGRVLMATALVDLYGSGSGQFDQILLPDNYRPTDKEEFMCVEQRAYFLRKLRDWKESIVEESRATMAQLQVDSLREPDIADRASSETDWSIELRTRDRQRKLIAKIDAAVRRLYDGEYGYCEVTGEPISLARLEARPIATMTLEAQEKHERIERVSRDD